MRNNEKIEKHSSQIADQKAPPPRLFLRPGLPLFCKSHNFSAHKINHANTSTSKHTKKQQKMEIATRPMQALHRSPYMLRKPVTRMTGTLKKRSFVDLTETSSLSSFSNHSSQECRETECLAKLRRSASPDVSDGEILRFAIFHSFQYDETLKAIQEHHDSSRLNLCMSGFLLRQFNTTTLFPLPGLRTKDRKCDVLYMRPSRYVPSKVKTSHIIDNLCYALNDLSRTKDQCQNGVAFIANMNGWTMKNFSHEYCFQFMQALQGKMVPTRVSLFLIVNPPKWFGKVWAIMKPMLSKSFAKKVHMIPEDRLEDFLMSGYEQYLPDEFACGFARTEEICEDYIDFRRYEDELMMQTTRS